LGFHGYLGLISVGAAKYKRWLARRFAMPRRVASSGARDGSFCATFDTSNQIRAKVVIVATGGTIPALTDRALAEFEGSKSNTQRLRQAATLKGHRGVIISGGNSSQTAAMFLSRSRHVPAIVRDQSLGASMWDLFIKAEADPAITIEVWFRVKALSMASRSSGGVTIGMPERRQRLCRAARFSSWLGLLRNTVYDRRVKLDDKEASY
jgi:thioredoxin reductase